MQLNIFLLYRGFEESFKNERDFEDINDFILKYDLKSIKILLDHLYDLKFIMKGKKNSSDIWNDSINNNTKNESKRMIITQKKD